jgi:hypothetical protein
MARYMRQILVAAILALYGSVSLFGTGMHALTGPLHSSHAKTSGNSSDEGLGQALNSAIDHCPICAFHVQGQLSVESGPAVSRPLIQTLPRIIRTIIAARDPHPSAGPRAPPIAPAQLV